MGLRNERHKRWTTPGPERQGFMSGAGPELVVLGAHGGAGCSTLAALLQPAWDLGAINPVAATGRAPVRTQGRPLILVARNTTAAAKRTTNAVTVLNGYRESIAALAIVSDGGREPADATARFGMLAGRVGGIVRVPFVRGLRLVDEPNEAELTKQAAAAVEELRDLAVRYAWTTGGRGC